MQKPITLAMILAGGRVDELNVLTCYRPKSAVPFGGFGRVIDFPLSNLMNSGIEQVAILSQYHSYSLINHIGTGAAWDMLGRYRGVDVLPPHTRSDGQEWYRGSADAVYKNIDYIQYHAPENILILSGDHIYHMDYQPLIDYHNKKNADLTMTVMKVPRHEGHRFGVAVLDNEDGAVGGRVTGYWEKPEDPQGEWASLTVLCFKPEKLYHYLKKAKSAGMYGFGSGIIPLMCDAGERVYGYKFCGYWGYTRTLEEYWQSNMDLLGDSPLIDPQLWGMRTNLDHRGIRDFQPTLVGDYASITNSLVYNGCKIYGTVRNSVVFPGVEVGSGSIVENSVLFFNDIIGKNCRLNKTICDVNTTFGDNVIVGRVGGDSSGAVTVVGWDNQVPQDTVIGEGAAISPNLDASIWKSKIDAGETLS